MTSSAMFKTFCWLLVAWVGIGSLHAQDFVFSVEEVPNPKDRGNGYVSDNNHLLSEDAVTQLNLLLASMENKSTAQMAVVVVPSIGEEVPKDFATRLFEHWGIGQKGADNGLLLLIVTDQRRAEIETGYGLEGLLPDIVCLRILLEELVPRFQQQDYDGGVVGVVKRVKSLLEDPEALAELRAALDPQRGWPRVMGERIHPGIYWYGMASLFFGLGVVLWLLINLFNKEDLYDKYRHIRYVKSLIFIFLFPIPYLVLYFVLKGVLNRLRNQRRFSKINGLPMHKMTEEEDDAYLEKGQVTEEVLGSIDYDVWVTDDGSDVMILKYASRFSKYSACPECKFKTYSYVSSRVISPATYTSSGSQELIYECKNCNYCKRDIVTIPMKTHSSSSSGGSRSGGGSWGGGSSGGGGAGASW
ncbi:MAG: TPM domain-containing protein [Saprospiraceae bacterium]|nr:TPM domain-containing protein [Saprospiraceae bacterium]